MMFKLLLLLASLTQANAQFLLTNALNLQVQALAEEEAAAEEAAAAEENAMTSAVQAMEEAEKLKAYEEAKAKGEPFAPDGTPIPENQNNGIRPLDPRTPTTFGDPFARENNVDEAVDESLSAAGLTEEELALLDLVESGELNVTNWVFDDVHDSMVYVAVPPRHLCGLNADHAVDLCGPTCNATHDFCVMGHVYGVDNFFNFYDYSMGMYQNWGQCFANATCTNLEMHDLILDSNDECTTRRFENPCKNPCDCFRSESAISMCHALCERTDSLGFVMCTVQRKQGSKIREGKIARELALAKSCAFNVYYEHPLMNQAVLTEETLPGLFETF